MHNTIFFQPEENSLGFVCVFDFVSLVFIAVLTCFHPTFTFAFTCWLALGTKSCMDRFGVVTNKQKASLVP